MKRNKGALGRNAFSSRGPATDEGRGRNGLSVERRSVPARQGSQKSGSFSVNILRLVDKCGLRLRRGVRVQSGKQLRFWEGPTVTIYDTGTVRVQGKQQDLAADFAKELQNYIQQTTHAVQLLNLSTLFDDD